MLILTATELETKISASFFQNPKVSRAHKQRAKNPKHEKTCDSWEDSPLAGCFLLQIL